MIVPSTAAVDRAAVQRGGFAAFVELAAHIIEPSFIHTPLSRFLAEHCERLYRGDCTMLVVNLPPALGKSTECSALFPAWIWTMDPSYQFMAASYAPKIARDLALRHREIVESPWYRERWDVHLADSDRPDGASEFWTTAGGKRLSVGAGTGQGLGAHGRMYLVDDPNAFKVDSGAVANMSQVRDWFQRGVLTRGKIGQAQRVLVVQQRLHEDDLSGYILRQFADDPGLCHVNLPWRFEPERKCVTKFGADWRKTPGEELSKELGDAGKRADFDRMARAQGGWNGTVARSQLQQDPTGGDDRIFALDSLKSFDGAPPIEMCAVSAISVDPTFGGKKNPKADYMAVDVWGYLDGKYYCYYAEQERRSFFEAIETIATIRARFPVTHVLIEESANGKALIETFKAAGVAGVEGVVPKGDKLMRAKRAGYHFSEGNVHFDKVAPWFEWKARYMVRFRGAVSGVHDDTIDAMTQAINWISDKYGQSPAFAKAMEVLAADARAGRDALHEYANAMTPGAKELPQLRVTHPHSRQLAQYASIAAGRTVGYGEP